MFLSFIMTAMALPNHFCILQCCRLRLSAIIRKGYVSYKERKCGNNDI